MDAIITYLLEIVPWTVAVVVVAIVSGKVMWKLAKYHSKLKDAKSKVDNLPCPRHEAEISDLKAYARSVDSMTDRLEEVCKWIIRIDADAFDKLAPKHSPRRMNRIGREVFEETGARQVFEDNSGFFLAELARKAPKTAYDVDEMAFEVLVANIHSPLLNPLKSYLYSGPDKVVKTDESGAEKEIVLSLGILLQLISLELRDRYMELYPVEE